MRGREEGNLRREGEVYKDLDHVQNKRIMIETIEEFHRKIDREVVEMKDMSKGMSKDMREIIERSHHIVLIEEILIFERVQPIVLIVEGIVRRVQSILEGRDHVLLKEGVKLQRIIVPNLVLEVDHLHKKISLVCLLHLIPYDQSMTIDIKKDDLPIIIKLSEEFVQEVVLLVARLNKRLNRSGHMTVSQLQIMIGVFPFSLSSSPHSLSPVVLKEGIFQEIIVLRVPSG